MRVATQFHHAEGNAMFFRPLFVLLAALFVTLSTSVEGRELRIGDTAVDVQIHVNGDGATFIRVHENETDAGFVGRRIVALHGGRFIDLAHRGTRDIAFAMQGALYRIDPNRIFTPEGIVKTLRTNDRTGIARAHAEVKKFADAILSIIGAGQPPIALHNNRGVGFGLSSYERRGLFASGSGKTLVYRGTTGGQNFYVVTAHALFEGFLRKGISVVYEPRGYNDGSLSYRYARDGIPYINVETVFGQRELQMQLAREAADLIMRKKPATEGRSR